jgi:Flp pilus assembly protein TadB
MTPRRSGAQYQIDKAAQRFGPQRAVDAWGLRHPVVNALSFVLLLTVLAAGGVVLVHAWYGLFIGLAVGALLILRIQANHRRRVANGTSAQYGSP